MNIQTLKEASDCLLNLAKPETQTIEHILLQDAFERILAEDITAKIPVPSFAKSAYDGYALRQADTAAASPEPSCDFRRYRGNSCRKCSNLSYHRRKSCTDHDRRTGSGRCRCHYHA